MRSMARVGLGVVALLAGVVGCSMCQKRADCDCDPEARSGYPSQVAPWAHPSDTGRYIGYEVGGGAVTRHGDPPDWPADGTWGWDYAGYCIPPKVILGWWHGRRCQGGEGAYRTDGPRPVHTIEGRNE